MVWAAQTAQIIQDLQGTRCGGAYPGCMVHAKRIGVWGTRYELSADGQPLGTWRSRAWRTGGTFDLAGRHYEVGGNLWGTRYTMTDESGRTVASADRVGRKRWTVVAGGRPYQFQRKSMWRFEEQLVTNEQTAGTVRRTSMWRGDAVADLPDLPLPVQVFVLVIVLTTWEAQSASAG
jgi:hypothetical protein